MPDNLIYVYIYIVSSKRAHCVAYRLLTYTR